MGKYRSYDGAIFMIDSYSLQYNMSEILIPGLALNQSIGEQQEQLYSQQRFVSLLQDLSERSVLYYCPYDRSSLRNFFQQIATRQGTAFLSLSTVHQFLSELKQRNRAELTRQAAYYSDLMGEKLKQGLHSVSRKELLKAMDKYDGDLQIITEIMRENSTEAEFIGCELVLELIRQVQGELEDAVIPELSITKLKTLRLESDRSEGEEQQGAKVAPIFSEIGQYEVKRLLTHYGTQVRRKLAFYREFIVDEEVLQDAEEFLSMLAQLEGALGEQVQQMIDANDHLNARGEEFNNLVANLEAEQSLQVEIIEGLKQQGEQLREELALADDQCGRLQEGIEELEAALHTTQRELSTIAQHSEAVQQELSQERRRYDEVYAQYCKLAEEGKRKSQLVREDESRRIFSSRSVKEQLEDTAQRLNRVLSERQRERKDAKQAEERNGNRIILLEGRLQELQRELRQKNKCLCEYIKESRLSLSKMSTLLRMSKITAPRPASTIHFDNNPQPLSDSLENETRESLNFTLQSVNSVHRLQRSSTVPRFSKVNLSIMPSIEEEDSGVQDINEAFGEQNVVTVLEEDLSERPLPTDSFKKKQSPQVSPVRSMPAVESKGKYFFSRGAQANIQGQKFQTYLLLTLKRFCYFDTKVRLEKYLPITNIKEFTFLAENPNLFIIKPSNPQSLIQGKHITNDMMFSTRNVGRMQAFLAQLRRKPEVKIAVNFRPIENAWLRVNKQDYNLGMGVRNSCHPCRIALAAQPVFYADFKGDGIFPSRTKTVLVVQPMGVLCFEGEEPYQLEQNRELFAWLPLTDKLRIVDKRNSKEAPERKLVIEYGKNWDRCWQIVFQTKDDTRRFRQAVEGQLELNLKQRQQSKQKMIKLLPSQIPPPA